MTLMLIFAVLFIAFASVSGCASLNAEKRAPMLGEAIPVMGVDMHVVTQGPRDAEAPPVVLIHGASVNLRDMKMALGDQLSEDRFVVIVDRPGRGYSERPEDGSDLEVQARLIKGVVDALGVERPVIVGQSFGGAVALNYALQYQDEMAGLVLLAPVSHEWPGGVAWYNHVATTPGVGFLFRRLMIPVYGALVGEGAVNDSFAPDEPPKNYYERAGIPLLFRSGDFRANASDIVNLKDEIKEQQGRYEALSLPVAIAHGEADDTVWADIHSKALVEQIPNADLTLLPDTGHALHHSQTEIILNLIRAVGARGS
ncbi:MAG: alpha/beta hydrolase [Pseudomonadota bacterium]